MIRRLRSTFGRLSPLARHVAVVAAVLVVLGVVASALTPASHPGRRTHRGSTGPRSSHQPRGRGQRRPSPVSAAELARARGVATRFLEGYLPFVYGRGSAKSVTAVTPLVHRQLTRAAVEVTPVERRRHPRVISLAAVGQAPGVVLATALVEDGGIASYALRITLREGPAGWLVSGVEGG